MPTPGPAWGAETQRAEQALAAHDADTALAAAHEAIGVARSTEEQVVAQCLLARALLLAGQSMTARAALQGALVFAVDIPADHPAVEQVRRLLAEPGVSS